MTQTDLAQSFHALHRAEDPLILYNIWDAATARACVGAGAKAVATGSHSVAEAQGYPDGQALPFDFLMALVARIVACVDVPVSVDFEAGYAEDETGIADNLARLIDIGVVGINFEDQIIGSDRLYSVSEQAGRLAALRERADRMDVPVYINARTDLFLKQPDPTQQAGLMEEALTRAEAYAQAGASGIFAPRLSEALVEPFCAAVSLPVNVMATTPDTDVADLAARGVRRISHGPFPFMATMEDFQARAEGALNTTSA